MILDAQVEPRMEPEGHGCPLCRSRHVTPFAEVRSTRYFRCAVCDLTYMAPEQRPTLRQELDRYRTHRNDPADPRYRAFLGRLAAPLVKRLSRGAEGLDYGAGPGPTLSVMLEEQGFRMEVHDPFFAPNDHALQRSYDFITATETVEHFFFPGEEFGRLAGMLRPGAWLGVMTQILEDDRDFAEWHYVRDPTHVCFYHPRTMQWIAKAHRWTLERPRKDVVLFQRGR